MAAERSVDYVVVGAGSAGSAVAARLSEDGGRSVLLLEAGGWDERPEIHRTDSRSVLALLTSPWSPLIDWGYATEPESALGGRSVPVARGKVVGGCSSVNALMWVRGSRHDYDGWRDRGNPGWGYDDVLPYFRRSEDYQGAGGELRGKAGPVSVRDHDSPTPLARAFVAGTVEAGFETGGPAAGGGDYNGAVQSGYGFLYQTTRTAEGERCSTATGYLHPARDRENLTVEVGARATRLLLEGTRAVGVEYLSGGRLRRVRARGEVIVCAGTFETPKLLMLSGIGPARQLRSHGIACVQDLPGVGENLQDHLFAPVSYQCRQEVPEGALLSEAGLFTHTERADPTGAPDLQFTFGGIKFLAPDAPEEDRRGPGFTFAPIALLPASRGRVVLRDADFRSAAVVRAGYLSDAADVEVLADGVELAREIAHTRAMVPFRGAELGFGGLAAGRAGLRAYVRTRATTLWHPVGTCRMGRGPEAVTDHELRVHGVTGLRVADASVMPDIVAGNTNAPSVMIGEKAADLVLRS